MTLQGRSKSLMQKQGHIGDKCFSLSFYYVISKKQRSKIQPKDVQCPKFRTMSP